MGGSLGSPTWVMTTLSRLKSVAGFHTCARAPPLLPHTCPSPPSTIFLQPPELAQLGSG